MNQPIDSGALAQLLRQRTLLQIHADQAQSTLAFVQRIGHEFADLAALSIGVRTWSYRSLLQELSSGKLEQSGLAALAGWIGDDDGAAIRHQALQLLQLCGIKPGRRFGAAGALSQLVQLGAAMALLSGSCFVQGDDEVDVWLVESPADVPAMAACAALVLAFGAPVVGAPERADTLWFIDCLPLAGHALLAQARGGCKPLATVALRDADGAAAAPGAFGQLILERAGRDALATGRWGRQQLDGSLSLLPFVSGECWFAGQALDLNALEAALREVGGLRELCVLAKQRTDGQRELVVYYTVQANSARPPIEAALRQCAQAIGLALTLLELARLPRTAGGVPDLVRLAALPVLDHKACAAAAAVLGVTPGVLAVHARPVSRAPVQPQVALAPTPVRKDTPAPLGTDVAAGPADVGAAWLRGPELVLPAGTPHHLAGLLERAALWPDRVLVFIDGAGERRLSYAELAASARAGAALLQADGVQQGEPVLLHLAGSETMLLWFWACQYAGAVATPGGGPPPPAADAKLLVHLADRLAARCVISDHPDLPAPLARRAATLVPDSTIVPGAATWTPCDPPPTAVALILLTSGSTSEPKLVPQNHAALIAQGYASGAALGLEGSDVSLNWMPLDHVGGLVMSHLRDVQLGCTQVQAGRAQILADPWRWFALVQRFRVTLSWAPNFAYAMLGAAAGVPPVGLDVSSLRYLINGGEAVLPDVTAAFLTMAGHYGMAAQAMKPAWGMSETCSLVCVDMQGVRRHAAGAGAISIGHPVAGVELRVTDEADALLAFGQVGRLQVRGPSVMAGYVGAAPGIDHAEGAWLRTGDLAVLGAQGACIVGRDKDVVVVNGRNIATPAIEREVGDIEGLDATGTVALAYRAPDSGSEVPLVLFVVQNGASAAAVGERIRTRLRQRMQLDVLTVPIDGAHIPRTAIGKPQRQKLQQRVDAGEFVDALAGSASAAAPLPAWFFRPQWQACQPQPGAAAPGRWLVLSADEADAGALRAAGQSVRWQALPADAGALTQLACGPGEALLLVPSAAGLAPDLMLLHIARQCDPRQSWQCLVLHDEAASAPMAARLGAAQGTLLSIQLERPQWRLRMLGVGCEHDRAARAALLLAEAGALPDRALVRYRGARRETPLLMPDNFLEDGIEPLRADGVYLVVGALGALGSQVCRWLLQQRGASVLGVGRWDSAAAAVGDQRTAAHAELSRWPQFRYLTLDVTDSGFSAALAPALAQLGALDGAFHLAGDFTLAALESLTPEAHERQGASKADGTRHLAEALAHHGRPGAALPLVLFGSVNGWFGGAGAASYAAACAAQQALAEHLGRDALANVLPYYLGWSQWEQLGLSRDNASAALARRQGFMPIDLVRGMQSLERALAGAPGVLFIGLDADNIEVLAACGGPVRDPMLRLEVSAAAPLAPQSGEHSDRFGCRFEVQLAWQPAAVGSVAAQRYRELETTISGIWSAVLGGATPDVSRNFFELGGNSLRLLQVKARLESELHCQLEVADLFRLATIQQLALHLAGAAGAATDEAAWMDDIRARAAGRRRARGGPRQSG